MPTGLVLIFEEAFLCDFFSDSRFVQNLSFFSPVQNNPLLKLTNENYDILTGLMLQIEKEIGSFKVTDKHILRAILYQVLIWLNRQYGNVHNVTEKAVVNRHIATFINLLEKEFANSHSVSFYADRLHITPNHLNDLTCQHLGKPVKHYIIERIMLEAKRLLGYSDLSISETALKIGFLDTSYFVRSFKKWTGLTPLAYRRKQNP